jgi:hypothetical protein
VPTDPLLEFADDLERLVRGDLSADDIRERYGWKSSAPELIQHSMCHIEHYLSDTDIRAKSESYREMQEGEMSKLIRLLRAGAPSEEIVRIHFLGRSID